MFILSYYLIKKEDIKINIDYNFIIKNIFTIIIIIAILYYINKNLNLLWESRIESVKYILIYLLVYWISLVIINLKEIKAFIKEIKNYK